MLKKFGNVGTPVVFSVMVLALVSCTAQMQFPVSEDAQAEMITQNINVVRITTENIVQYRNPDFVANRSQASNPPADPNPYIYRVGPGDELRIVVWSDLERTQGAALSVLNAERGIIVDEQGQLFYPFVGFVRASGSSTSQIQTELTERLRDFVTDPQVEVSVLRFNAQKATVTGFVVTPGPVTITNVPQRLLDVLNQVGMSDSGDLENVLLRRRGTAYNVNLQAFINNGEVRQNPIILPGDVINVPPMRDNKIFTFGEIPTKEIQLKTDLSTSLTEVLAGVGGIDRIRADSRGIFVFRRTQKTPDGFDVFQFNLHSATTLVLATDFKMAPLDIVFVTNDPITRWNDTVNSLVTPLSGLVRVQRLVDSND